MPNEFDDLVAATPDEAALQGSDPAPSNDFDSLVNQYGSANEQALRASVQTAVQTEPDRHAKLVALASKNRVPVAAVEADPETFERNTKFNAVDFARIGREHPELSSWLSNPDNAALAQDDLPVLRTLDHALRSITDPDADPTGTLPQGYVYGRDGAIVELAGKRAGTYAGRGQADAEAGTITFPDRATLMKDLEDRTRADDLNNNATKKVLEDFGPLRHLAVGFMGAEAATARVFGMLSHQSAEFMTDLQRASAELSPGIVGDLQRGAGGLVADIPLMLAGGPLGKAVGSITRLGRLAPFIEAAASVQPLALREGITTGMDHGVAAGAVSWLIETAIPGAFGHTGIQHALLSDAEKAVANTGVKAFALRLLKDAGMEGTEEAVTEFAHAIHETASGMDPHALDADRLFSRLFTAAALGAGAGVAFNVPSGIGEHLYHQQMATEAAQGYAERLGVVVDQLAKSKLMERSPAKADEMIATAVGANDKVYAQSGDWDAHWTAAGADPLAVARTMGVEQSYREAKATGADMAIPVATYAKAAVENRGLIDIARQVPGAKSKAEAAPVAEAAGNADKAELESDVKATAKAAESGDKTAQGIRELLTHDLIESGHYDSTAAKRQAEVIAAFYQTNAKRMGTTAEELFAQYPVTVKSSIDAAPGQTVFKQGERVPADGIKLTRIEALRARLEAFKAGTLGKKADAEAPTVRITRTLNHGGTDAPRAQIAFGADHKYTVTLNESRDLTSFIHEGGHAFLEIMGHLAADPNASAEVKQDYAKILAYLGIEGREGITEAHHETFARSLEAYMMEGKAPSPELRDTFQRIKAWFKDVYKSLRALNVTLTDDVRGVFDRMLASDDEIAAAEAEANASPLFATANDAGMTPEQFLAYRKAAQDEHDRSVRDLEQQITAAYRDEQTDQYKKARAETKAKATAFVEQQPVFAAITALQTGRLPNGEHAPDLKLSRADLVERYGEDGLAKLPGPKRGDVTPENRGKHLYSTDGIPLDQAAELFGFPSGDALYEAMVNAPSKRDVIEQETDAAMRLTHPDPLVDGSIHERAQEAVQSEGRGRVIEAELRAIRKLQASAKPVVKQAVGEAVAAERQRGDARVADVKADAKANLAYEKAVAEARVDTIKADQRQAEIDRRAAVKQMAASIPPTEILRATAHRVIGAKVERDLNPNVYLLAARVASREATKAMGQQDYQKAGDAKQRELLNHELYRAAMEQRAAVDKGIEFLRGMNKPAKREKIGQAGGWEWTATAVDGQTATFPTEEQARKAAGADGTYTRTSGYLENIDAILERFDLRPITKESALRRQSLRQWIADRVEAGEQVDIPDHVIDETLRKNYRELTVDEINGVVDAVKNIAHMAAFKRRLSMRQKQRDFDTLKTGLLSSIVDNGGPKKPAKFGRSPLDEPGRLFGMGCAALRKFASLIRQIDGLESGGPLWDALVRPANEVTDEETTRKASATAALSKLTEEWGKLGPLATLRHRVPGTDIELSLEGRICLALNWGNEGNRSRLLEAGWTEQQIGAVLDTLDAKDVALLNGIWKHLDSYRSDIAAKEQRVTGVAPTMVDALPFTVRGGSLTGGYLPIKNDERLSPKAYGQLAAEQIKQQMQGAVSRATTRRSHTKARGEKGTGDQLRFDLGVVYEHVNQVVHDLTHHEYLLDANKILRDRDIQKAIVDHYGVAVHSQLNETINTMAAGDITAQQMGERSLNWVRSGTSLAMQAWNLQSGVMQVTGFMQSLHRVGPVHMAKAFARVFADAVSLTNSAAWVDSRSEYVSNRGKTMFRELNELRNQVAPTGALEPIRQTFYWFMAKLDRAVAVPTWIASYEKAMDAGESEERAAAIADQDLRDTQGSGSIHDLAGVQRGSPAWKVWTTFYHYFNTTYNLTAESAVAWQRGMQMPTSLPAIGNDIVKTAKLASDLVILYALPAAMTVGIKHLLGKDRKRETVKEAFAKEALGMLLGTVPLVREMASSITEGRGWQGPTGARGFEAVSELIGQIRQGKMDAGLARTSLATAGILLHLPSTQVQRIIDGFVYMQEHRTADVRPMLFGPPPKR